MLLFFGKMRRAKHFLSLCRRLLIPLIAVVLFLMLLINRSFIKIRPELPIYINPKHREHVHSYVKSVLDCECRPSFTRTKMMNLSSMAVAEPFLHQGSNLNQTFKYPPPFGFLNMRHKLQKILSLLPVSSSKTFGGNMCRRCVVVGNGGILRGLELGSLLNKFNVIIRLNGGPVRDFSRDVGNRTTIRMSYPEGIPKQWEDVDPELQFVAVIYKSVDFSWLRSVISRSRLSFWDKLFFWKAVPDSIPVKSSKVRLLNPEIIRETALKLLHYNEPVYHWFGWDQNVPTLGVTAINMATYLCDEVSLAGFGYNLRQLNTPVHYYGSLTMKDMLKQSMHNVDKERDFLKTLVKEKIIKDLTGGIHCSFCSDQGDVAMTDTCVE